MTRDEYDDLIAILITPAMVPIVPRGVLNELLAVYEDARGIPAHHCAAASSEASE